LVDCLVVFIHRAKKRLDVQPLKVRSDLPVYDPTESEYTFTSLLCDGNKKVRFAPYALVF
jgi:hypothetical protein